MTTAPAASTFSINGVARNWGRDLWGRNGGLYVGFDCPARTRGEPNLHGMPVEIITDRHLVLLGPNGSGKTRGFVYPNVLKLVDWSLVILDFKGEIFHSTAVHRAEAGNDVIALNPFGVRGIPSSGYNPVLSLNPGDANFVDECDAIANILSPVESKENRHFDEGAQDLISIPLLNTRYGDPATRTLSHMREMLNLPDTILQARMRTIAEQAELDQFHELLGRTSRFRAIKADDRELKSIISTARTKLRWLDSKPIYDDLSRGDFAWETMKEKATTTYLILPANRIYQHRNWLKLILHCILARLLNDPTPSKTPILFLLDEAAQIAGIPLIEQTMAMLRGFGIKIASLYQDYPQAQMALGDRVGSYMANSGVLIGYAPQDLDTAEMLSKRGGITQHYSTTLSLQRDAETRELSASYGLNPGERDAVLPQDLMNMPPGFAAYYSHQHAGARTVYFPDPSEVPEFLASMRPPRAPRAARGTRD